MTSHLDQHKAELEKLCSFLKDAISKAARRKHRLCCSVQREEPAMTVETPQGAGIVDLSEIDSLLAKARTVRIDVDKCDKHHTERKKEIKDSSKKRIDSTSKARPMASSTHSVKQNVLPKQRGPLHKAVRSATGTERKPIGSSTIKAATLKETKNAISLQESHLANLEGKSESTKPAAIDPAAQELLDNFNKISHLKKRMRDLKAQSSDQSNTFRCRFIAEAEKFFTSEPQGLEYGKEECEANQIDVAANFKPQNQGSNNVGFLIKNNFIQNKESIIKAIITSFYHHQNIYDIKVQSFEDVGSLIDLVLDMEAIKIDMNITEMAKRLASDVSESIDISKSEKLAAYRKLHSILFDNGERLPTLVNDSEESEGSFDSKE